MSTRTVASPQLRYRRFMSEVVDEAGQLKGDPETLRLVEEWLPIDNEAMELAEAGPRRRAESEDG